MGSESARTADDFDAFLRSLAEAGYTSINIIAHSMGARIYFNSLNRGSLDDILMVRLAHSSFLAAGHLTIGLAPGLAESW